MKSFGRWPHAVALIVLVGTLAGCGTASGAGSSSAPSTSAAVASASLPAGGTLLADAGIEHGPDGFSVPTGLVTEQVIDQSNVVTLVVDEEQGAILEAYLRQNLTAMGFEITGDVTGSLLFAAPGWEGAYTSGGGVAGMTLRRDPGSFSSPG
ncbi:hypothetical protein GCM10009785_04520 [Brooklawnia cerclae]|uniref:Uncharacterized protein n=1 Tax=Brooklawnia cerclae TaxID=349934 RepID=A0ABX0SGU9_9ACTN|nr:hypothetical protein [Brooklawnia cerclae]NIH55956.1 hypothetical protein [Brooklawnia cerclae]